ncbi:hypothetical protein RB614_25070 [Phytohabitans sp. ZYX-F-186]|uniref:Uncharacterized protein n=1 Tax=Phytohabitans maris TaxID=3071409 RepID=A0ABU0ZL78_9ACTN|nr:hypothetical protein [Phytohabitans sp. ZYX-F-186]MDQ7907798.1 hypothetical protein [Phytohabitans sp. ZYX-F-186]
MRVLFLGGPWHGERHEVAPARVARGHESLPTHFNVPSPAETGGRVTYLRRFALGGGERRPVYVAADYHGPARA